MGQLKEPPIEGGRSGDIPPKMLERGIGFNWSGGYLYWEMQRVGAMGGHEIASTAPGAFGKRCGSKEKDEDKEGG